MDANPSEWAGFIERVGYPVFVSIVLFGLLAWVIHSFLKELKEHRRDSQQNSEKITNALDSLKDVIRDRR